MKKVDRAVKFVVYSIGAILLILGGLVYYCGITFDANYIYNMGDFLVLLSVGMVSLVSALTLITYVLMSVIDSQA